MKVVRLTNYVSIQAHIKWRRTDKVKEIGSAVSIQAEYMCRKVNECRENASAYKVGWTQQGDDRCREHAGSI